MLTRIMLHLAKRLSLELDARKGEHQVATHLSESTKQFQALQRSPEKAGNGKAPSPKIRVSSTKQGRDQRTVLGLCLRHKLLLIPLNRVWDSGDQGAIPLEKQARHLYTKPLGLGEEISVTLREMEEAGVSRFECPTCLVMRDTQPKKDRMKFTWHSRRTTNTPNHGLRWIKRENVWRLSDDKM